MFLAQNSKPTCQDITEGSYNLESKKERINGRRGEKSQRGSNRIILSMSLKALGSWHLVEKHLTFLLACKFMSLLLANDSVYIPARRGRGQ